MLTWFLPSFTVQAKKPVRYPGPQEADPGPREAGVLLLRADLVINGEEVKVNVKAIQRHPVRYKLVHLISFASNRQRTFQ
jgi:hypothetical protein